MANNEENLKPFDKLTVEEQRKICSKGGKKSGEVRRERKKFREMFKILLAEDITDKKGNKKNTQEAICIAQIREALKGNTKAFETIRDTIGEKPIDNVVNNIVSQVNVTKNDIKEALNDINSLN